MDGSVVDGSTPPEGPICHPSPISQLRKGTLMWTMSGFADEIDPDLETQCTILDQLGIKYIEFRSAWDTNVLDLDDDQIGAAAEILAAHNLTVSCIGSPIGKINIEEDFDEHLVRMDRAVTVAERLNAPYIRVFSFFLRPEQAPADHRDEVMGRMRSLAEKARDADLVLLHENEKEIYGDIPSRVLDIVETVNLPSLKLAWDPANYVQVGVSPFTDAYSLVRLHTVYIQIKDAIMGTGDVVPAGEGDGEVRETVQALLADGFDGFFSIEPHLSSSHQFGGYSGADNFIRASRAFTRILDEEGISYT